ASLSSPGRFITLYYNHHVIASEASSPRTPGSRRTLGVFAVGGDVPRSLQSAVGIYLKQVAPDLLSFLARSARFPPAILPVSLWLGARRLERACFQSNRLARRRVERRPL